ncbi:hypothetical protein M422DRAFT_214395 [Sphaerobolus stellatus SS14]|uniref:SH3 domain-containing protein n=1 Tax=Sphaerobolus stellatus (strain SS14) TaxID=990650 RepID=A0A0C9V1E1_SPHS4|nr:hypothetical protein M422DRAFT_235575 [Sphaerobolus stellatus SS14]KIJ31285.1 hypothetical protein M422DRAFT_214395 [Sphaerobolus stellatus SS14]
MPGTTTNATQNNGVEDQNSAFCRALYDYTCEPNDVSCLSFREGDIIEVLTKMESGWWDGLLNDVRGWFPSNYVVVMSEQEYQRSIMVRARL